MAGGTGGHIFPGLAVAQALREKGWRVHWLGAPNSMESRLVPAKGFPLELVEFSGVRGKGLKTLALLPLRLLRAFWQAWQVIGRVRPDVVVGLGGYITFPGGMMAVFRGKPLVLHEQNSVAGLVNKVLAQIAERVYCAFPGALAHSEWVGNPLRTEFLNVPGPQERFDGRTGPLKVLVVGGSLGAKALNTVVPQALALIPESERPIVTHQAGEKQIDELRANYVAAGIGVAMRVAGQPQDAKAPVGVTITPFIDNTAQAFADADLVICRAGASTVTELAAVGAASILVPFPHAVDDHQTTNARFLSDAGAGVLVPQSELTPAMLADLLQKTERPALIARGLEAKKLQKLTATDSMVLACEALAKGNAA
jgi:UDP-N-acetylglucosamine--N-acetylmuramyl-(pentapeptide) pyrophosphoryl-undecaprenol N-acetylglucosamine transferase